MQSLLNAIVDLRTGTPFTVILNSDVANAGGLDSQRANYVHAERTTCSRQTVLTQVGATRNSCLDATVYAIPAAYTYGNAHRNDSYGPGAANTNLSVFKNFTIHDDVKFQFRAEGFNVFNHPNPALIPSGSNTGPTTTLGGSQFGQITAAQTTFTATGARILQVAGKINF